MSHVTPAEAALLAFALLAIGAATATVLQEWAQRRAGQGRP